MKTSTQNEREIIADWIEKKAKEEAGAVRLCERASSKDEAVIWHRARRIAFEDMALWIKTNAYAIAPVKFNRGKLKSTSHYRAESRSSRAKRS